VKHKHNRGEKFERVLEGMQRVRVYKIEMKRVE